MSKTFERFNIYLVGVGGQGIGLLSEAIIRGADYASQPVRGVDTHGLAQRGGMVESFIRFGENVQSPLVRKHDADLVISLEKNEVYRAIGDFLKPGGKIIYYETILQPLNVRMRNGDDASDEDIDSITLKREGEVHKIKKDDLKERVMQNTVVLAEIAKKQLIPEISKENYLAALTDLLKGEVLQKNLDLFNEVCGD